MRQMTGDILSLGDELFVHQPDIELRQFSSTRLDLKLKSVKLNDSGLYTCMFNDDKLVSFLVEIFGKRARAPARRDSAVQSLIELVATDRLLSLALDVLIA